MDAARAVALIGMIVMHLMPLLNPDGSETPVATIALGRAAALFAVLAGLGIAVGTGGSRPPSGREWRGAAVWLLARAVAMGVIGTAVHLLFHPPVSVILMCYALLFIVGIPLLRLRRPVLLWLAATWCVVGPALSHFMRAHLSESVLHGSRAHPIGYLTTALLTGDYPVVPWITYLIVGIAVGRMDLRSGRTAAALCLGGAVLVAVAQGVSDLLLGPIGGARALARVGAQASELHRYMLGTTPTDSWWWLAVTAAHSGTPLDLMQTTGTALAVLGVCLLLARAYPRVIGHLAAIGAIPLTLYTAHVVALGLDTAAVAGGGSYVVVQLGVVGIAAMIVRVAGRHGPLEAVVAMLSGAARRAALRTETMGLGRFPRPRGPAPGDVGRGAANEVSCAGNGRHHQAQACYRCTRTRPGDEFQSADVTGSRR